MAEDIIAGVSGIIGAIILAFIFITSIIPAFSQISPESSWVLIIGSIGMIIIIIASILKLLSDTL
jgi:hypothetical protein